jgi:hypothetical protein
VTPTPGEPIFYDNFDRYTPGQTLDNVTPLLSTKGGKWSHIAGDRGDARVGTGGRNGGNCLDVVFTAAGADYSYIEQHLQICGSKAQAPQECWIEYYLLIDGAPTNHTGNNKFMTVHNNFFSDGGNIQYGRMSTNIVCEGMDLYSSYGAFVSMQYDQFTSAAIDWSPQTRATGGVSPFGKGYPGNEATWQANWGKACLLNPSGVDQRAITQDQAGEWTRYRFYFKQNDIGQQNGEWVWYRNNDPIQHTKFIYRDWQDGYNKQDGLSLGGYHASGYNNNVIWKYDDIAIYDTDPGWTFEPPPPPPPPGGGGTGETNLSAIQWAPSFIGGTHGENVGTALGLHNTDALLDTNVKLGNEPSARDDIKYGDQGLEPGSRPGGQIGMQKSTGGNPYHEGDEIWWRVYIRTSTGFNHAANEGPIQKNNTDSRKTMRISGKNLKVDFKYFGKRTEVWNGATQSNMWVENGSWGVEWEGTHDRKFLSTNGQFRMPDQTWISMEVYVKFSTSASVGRVRLWQDGVQVGNTQSIKTIHTDGFNDWMTGWLISHWGSGAPKDQTLWWARPAIALRKTNGSINDTGYMARDASGFPMIGLAV